MTTTSTVETHRFVVGILEKNGFKPHGSDGVTWMHPDGTKISYGYANSVFRLRRHPVSHERFNHIPPVIWDLRGHPTEAEVAHFIGVGQAPELSEDELARVMAFDEAEPVGESFRSQLVAAMEQQISSGLTSAEDMAGAAIMVMRGQR